MEEEKDLQDERIDTVANFEKFKEEYKSMYYVYYIHKYPDSSYLQYLDILKTLYTRQSSKLNRFIRENKDKIPDWVIEKKEEKMWFDGLEFNKKLILEFDKILEFLYDEYDIENGKLVEKERHIKKITDVKEKTQNKLPHSNKIQLKGSLQSIGYLFSELIDRGFIEAPKRNGKNNTSAISRMILQHFEFVDKEEQPKPEDIRKTLFTENKLSADKQALFKIPESKIINND